MTQDIARRNLVVRLVVSKLRDSDLGSRPFDIRLRDRSRAFLGDGWVHYVFLLFQFHLLSP